MRLCALSVDLDEIRSYQQIHGAAYAGLDQNAVYDVALPRYDALSKRLGLPLTLFVVGADLERRQNAQRIGRMSEAGHEIGNHTQNHYYDFTRRPRAEMRRELLTCSQAIRDTTGRSPLGFRAPGYTITDEVYELLVELDFAYSSSVFPCPAYWGLKATLITGKRWLGRRSQSVVDSARVLTAPRHPYHVGRPYYCPGDGLLELPIETTPRLRLPVIGTALNLMGVSGARRLVQSLVGQSFINIELHGVDLLDSRDGLHALARDQFDLRRSVAAKAATLRGVVAQLRAAGYQFVTLSEASKRLAT